MTFSPEDDAYILKHYRPGNIYGSKTPGMSTKDIAEHLDRPRNSIITRYHSLKGHRGRGTEPDYTKIVDRGIGKRYSTPGIARTKFEDLDLGKYDDL